jgi:hypothetical protein
MPRRRKDAPPPEPTQDTHVYIPVSLHRRVWEVAQENRRSLNAQILVCLEQCLDNQQAAS